MSRVSVEHDAPEQRDTPPGVLLRLWDDLEQRPTVPPSAPRALVHTRVGTTSIQRYEAADVMPTRVRYSFD